MNGIEIVFTVQKNGNKSKIEKWSQWSVNYNEPYFVI